MQNVVNSLEKTWTPYFLRRLFLNLKIVSVPYPLLKSQKIESIIWQWQAARSMNRTCQNISTLLTTAQICQKRARSRLPMKNGPSIWLHDRLIQVLWNWSTIQKHIPSYTIKVITNKNYNRGKRTALYLMKTCAFFIDWTDITLGNFACWGTMTGIRLQQRHNGDMYEIIQNESGRRWRNAQTKRLKPTINSSVTMWTFSIYTHWL